MDGCMDGWMHASINRHACCRLIDEWMDGFVSNGQRLVMHGMINAFVTRHKVATIHDTRARMVFLGGHPAKY